jgi:hypothetical protein
MLLKEVFVLEDVKFALQVSQVFCSQCQFGPSLTVDGSISSSAEMAVLCSDLPKFCLGIRDAVHPPYPHDV